MEHEVPCGTYPEYEHGTGMSYCCEISGTSSTF